jgi:hypothetical protein
MSVCVGKASSERVAPVASAADYAVMITVAVVAMLGLLRFVGF